ncbi:solute carrier family 2, facilitated glucose transporter member 5-like [Clavelina lepadiformis]|uniref:solute carrier family 2, facilitated glucose transporter member 5-like n=1 Tax=Clavelina lepadiformis TaxID=159417 RepID=UPI004042DAD5
MSECHGAVLPSSCVQNGNVAVESPLVENGDDASDHVTNKNKAANEKLTCWVVWSSLIALFAGGFPYGYPIGSINSVAVPARKAFQEYYQIRHNTTLSEDGLNLIWTVTAMAHPIGGLVGCFIPNFFVKNFGQLRSMLYGHVVVVIASVFLGLTSLFKSFEVVVIARAVIGVCGSSVGTSITPTYIVEINPTKWRGVFSSMSAFFITFGVFIANVLGLPEILGGDELWPVMLALTGLPSLVFFSLFYFMPESPRHLYITEGRKEEARKLLTKLRKCEDVSDELDKMETELQSQASSKQMSLVQLFRSRTLRFQLVSTIVLGFAYQLTGLSGIMSYLNQLFMKAGISSDISAYGSIITTAVMIVTACLTSLTIKRVGRKKLLFIGYLIEGISFLLLTITIEIGDLVYWIPYLSILFSTTFTMGFIIGPAATTFLVVSEFFSQSARTAALMTTSALVWTAYSLVVISLPYALAALRGFTFLIFSSIAFAVAVFVYFAVPETKDRSFVEIQQIFKKKKFCCNSRDSSNLSMEKTSLEKLNMTSSA